jgi:hypothetical protein
MFSEEKCLRSLVSIAAHKVVMIDDPVQMIGFSKVQMRGRHRRLIILL